MTVHPADDFRAKEFDVFISYRHLDADIRDVVKDALEAANITVWYDGKLVSGAFRPQLADRITFCKLVVALWSERVAASPAEVGDEMSQARGLDRLMVLRTDTSEIPPLFREQNFMPFNGWADPVKRADQLDAIVAEVRRRVAAPAYVVTPTGAATTTLVAPPEFGDIPGAPPRLIGRDAELAMLRAAWASAAPRKINAVVLYALGGAGKSALLRTFANELLAAGGGGARRIYGWSAYSQGSGEQKRADADGFISKALGDLGYPGELPKDPIERARALAKLVQRERTLLLLDGLEPLQDPPGVNAESRTRGKFKDKGLAELIKQLANQNPGLVILTTRQEVPELSGHGSLVTNHPLDHLSDPAGAELLVELGVRGRQRELEAAVRSVEGHALSVTLLGTYLSEVCGGDIRHRDQFNFADLALSPDEQSELITDKTIVPAKRAAKVMRGYLEQFDRLARDGPSQGLGGPERAILHLLGLFDRPADGKAVAALLHRRIPGLTDELFVEPVEKKFLRLITYSGVRELDARERGQRIRNAKARLRKLKLLSAANPADPQELDAHPIVRAFFSGRLAETAPEAATSAHDILYHHYSARAPELPDTLDEMQPLFSAVQHGVKAGRAQEVYRDVFQPRLRRGNGNYSLRVLGAFGPYVTTLANFFDPPWRSPRRDLTPGVQVWLLSSAAFALTALGRLADSVEPRRAGLEALVASKSWANAAIVGGELTDTLLALGRVTEAVSVAEAAVAHADRSGDENQRELSRTHLGAALTAVGDIDRAAALFAVAEAINLESNPAQPQLYSLQGYWYGDLILALGDAQDALARGRYQLDLAERYLGKGLGLDDIGLGHLLIGRAQDALGQPDATHSLDAAVAGLRKAGTAQFTPRALLARVVHRRRRAAAGETGLIDGIRTDLNEVADIAGDEMRLFLTDLALERARLALDVPSAFASPAEALNEAKAQTATAAQLIADTGYHRRDEELADLQARLAAA